MDTDAPRLYTPEQAARLLQVPASWLRKKAAAHAIAHTRIGRHLRFSTADLHALMLAGQHPPAEHPAEPS
ncbi:helix-turn-helix domain-containing protein [Streptomyces sp. NPDC050844]|uniref:helix-turn-helix domain-containing protein n=1 Tax=Streptomyces sp. NPDC050844 TaxID=3155790 RepID=UPI0033CFA086